MRYLLSWVCQWLCWMCMCSAVALQGVMNCLASLSHNKLCVPRNSSSLHHVVLQSSLPSRALWCPLIHMPFHHWQCAPGSHWSWTSRTPAHCQVSDEGTCRVHPNVFFFLLCWCFSSMERQVTMAFTGGDYPHARDRIGHIALLGGRYIVLLFVIHIVEKVKVCFFLLLPWSVC